MNQCVRELGPKRVKLGQVFYGERRVVLRDEWRVFFTLDFLLQALLMPIHCLAYIFYKIKWCPCKRDKEEDVINIRGKTAASLVNVVSTIYLNSTYSTQDLGCSFNIGIGASQRHCRGNCQVCVQFVQTVLVCNRL